jgi:hypothetical protein
MCGGTRFFDNGFYDCGILTPEKQVFFYAHAKVVQENPRKIQQIGWSTGLNQKKRDRLPGPALVF